MINYCISSIRTPTFKIIIPISEYLHLAELKTGVAERLLAFDSLCGARARVTKRFLAYYRCFRMSTRLLVLLRGLNGGCQTCDILRQSLWSSNRGRQTCTSLQQSLRGSNGSCQMCTSLRQSLGSSNGGCQTWNSLRQSLRRLNRGSQMSFNNLCGARMGVRECLLAFDRPSYNYSDIYKSQKSFPKENKRM